MLKKIEVPSKNITKQIENKLEFIQNEITNSKTVKKDTSNNEDEDEDDYVMES